MARAPVFVALLCLAAIALASGADARKMVGVYVLKKGDFSVKITNWGATIMSIVVPDSKGMLDDFLALR
jgi:aldose 1-epimerase